MGYRFYKGREFEIYTHKFGTRRLIGTGVFMGKERIVVVMYHGLATPWIPKFKLNDSFIYGHECEYRPIGSKEDDPYETTELK